VSYDIYHNLDKPKWLVEDPRGLIVQKINMAMILIDDPGSIITLYIVNSPISICIIKGEDKLAL